jgi:hypothetical protein
MVRQSGRCAATRTTRLRTHAQPRLDVVEGGKDQRWPGACKDESDVAGDALMNVNIVPQRHSLRAISEHRVA